MKELNIRMNDELFKALQQAAKNCGRTVAESVRVCLRSFDTGFVMNCAKNQIPTTSGNNIVSVELPNRWLNVDHNFIRFAVAVKLASLPEPSLSDEKWVMARSA